MIRTLDIDQIPNTWIFENYCNLTERLHGQDLKIRSLFNPGEKTPSMCIFYKYDQYYFKDFSSGNSGNSLKLVQKLFGLSKYDAITKIINDYHCNTEHKYEVLPVKPESKFKVSDFKKRKWTVLDKNYWTQFNIGSRLLEKYKVYPLEYVIMSKETEGTELSFKLNNQYMYGYFKEDGSLAKVYRPKSKSLKFINVIPSFIHGDEQLKFDKDTLVICSSMKDGLGLLSLKFDVEFVAPGSENTMIPKQKMAVYLLKYANIYVLFDNDNAGHKAMTKYKNNYGIEGIYLNLSKDLSDSIKDYKPNLVRSLITSITNIQ